ncbi:zinc transporter ZntB [Ectothiorhodospiraceae bacterium WFHF3C12]|nr:zinc transporter ZntB [Ectothiorhodospiraceae bacterium WFHF3C12]
MEDDAGLICAYLFDTDGNVTALDWDGVNAWQPAQGFLWLDLNRLAPEAHQWLESESGLDRLTIQALLQEETRPRAVLGDDHALVFLRGANFNPGTQPDDMVSIRAWLDADRLVSLHGQDLRAIDDLRNDVRIRTGPRKPGQLLTAMAVRLVDNMGPVVHGLEEQLDELEETLLVEYSRNLRGRLAALRRQAINFRRFVAPQRDVLHRLVQDRPAWLEDYERERMREAGERLTRLVEDLDAIRERAAVSQEELATRLSDQMNRNMYVLSLAAALFLPLGFVTGLLGINVGGMPGVDSEAAFWIVCAVLVVLGGIEALFFYLRRWL